MKTIIGLAGGIGSGKSTVAAMMQRLGAAVFDADAAARKAWLLPEVQATLRKWWPDARLIANGTVDRSWVAARVFEEEALRKRLEQLIHPIVQAQRDAFLAAAEADPAVRFIVLDVPLLMEVGLDRGCDVVVFVDADLPTRLRRVAGRGWDESELRRREENQWPLDRKRQAADAIIDNSGDEDHLVTQIKSLIQRTVSHPKLPNGMSE